MAELPRELYRPDQVAELDRRAIEDYGTPGIELMERAGAAAYRALRTAWPDRQCLCVLCGGGNNGGDGYVIAELARRDGLWVDVLYLSDPERLRGDAATVAARYRAQGRNSAFAGELPPECDLIVDAMLGTGLQRPVEGRYREAVDAVNACGLPVLAVDIPSGLHGGTGAVLGAAVRADITPTFIGLKAGLFTGAGPQVSGRVLFAGLEVPAAVYEGMVPVAWRADYAGLRHRFPRRERAAHKGRYGHVLVVGGDNGMGGAALMAAHAAARSGAGLVSVVTRSAHVPGFLAARPELMVHDPDALPGLLDRVDVLVLGPGLGQGEWGDGLFRDALAFQGRLVLDADALNRLAKEPVQRDDWVLTPHPGEAARLLGGSTAEVQADRFAAIAELRARFGGTILLKGAGTLVLGESPPIGVCTDGNPGMASGGMGDVLSGVIGGLMAQGMTPADSALAGACVHAAAADCAAVDGERGLLATDLLEPLRGLLNPL
ncbi:NAD(P)H-hydrate dehydratase [Aquisalimonas sp.]|uniref:NAD(P)H-hydrate dehydratase n=1 Tax=Aquisalimonas sp. TaxID=1872621 RepID=UPI0025BEA3A6|nr:NAD(P)H-hydrate dehydratase [Aquisalimonas sp.]